MSVTYSFSDNITYGTDHINDITRRLCGAGVAPFPSKTTYNVSDLNVLTSALTGQGVGLEGCKCSIETLDGENRINVGQGIVFFKNGATLEVDSEGYCVTVPIGTAGYVYAYFSPAAQKGEILFADQIPNDGYGVPLAWLDTNNTLEDCRSFARSKVATMGKNLLVTGKLTKVGTVREVDGMYLVQTLEGVNLSGFRYAVLATPQNRKNPAGTAVFPEFGDYTLFWDIEKGQEVQIFRYSDGAMYENSSGHFYSKNGSYGVKKYYYAAIVDGKLSIVCKCNEKEKDKALSDAYECTVTLI